MSRHGVEDIKLLKGAGGCSPLKAYLKYVTKAILATAHPLLLLNLRALNTKNADLEELRHTY